tara:strand:- start:4391 stop:4963 length:573 start_codon:yes stop_codon:yes gene_type:complete
MTEQVCSEIHSELLNASRWNRLAVAQQYLYDKELDLTTEEWWELFRSAWLLAEHNSTGPSLRASMLMLSKAPPAPAKLREGIPNKRFKVYRGGSLHGLSWTKWKKKAVFFQKRRLEYDSYYNPVPLIKLPPLAERIVEPDDVYFFTDDREEKEVVIIPEEAWDYIETDAYQIECEEFTEKKKQAGYEEGC